MLIMKILLDENKPYYKANLHCHTTFCDGHSTPEEIKDMYKARGYSVVAYTSHEMMIDFTYLSDDSFIALKGYEQGTNNDRISDPIKKHQSAHFNFIAKDPKMDTMVAYNCDYDWLRSNEEGEKVKSLMKGYERLHKTEDFNLIIKTANENGFLSFYNHPDWSLHTYEDYIGLEGLCGMEVVNGNQWDMENVYDDMLRAGKKLHCLCTDDTHNGYPPDHPQSEAFRGFTMIQADEFSYAGIIAALESGNFYSSQAPQIKSITLDGNKLHVKASPAERISVYGMIRPLHKTGEKIGDLIDEAEFVLGDHFSKFFRVVVTDKYGKKAFSNAYYEMV